MCAHESFVSLSTARMLKEAGFDWETMDYWQMLLIPSHPNYGRWLFHEGIISSLNYNVRKHNDRDWYSAPTLAVAQRWLREVKGLWVSVTTTDADMLQSGHPRAVMYRAELWDGELGYHSTTLWNDEEGREYAEEFPSYELALEAGIKACLKDILMRSPRLDAGTDNNDQ